MDCELLEQQGHIPPAICDRMVLDVYQVEFNRDSQGIEDISVGYKLLEDWAILDEIELKLSKAGVGFKLSKPNDPKKRAIAGSVWGEIQISAATTLLLSSNLVTDRSKWELVGELKNVRDVDLGRLLSRIAPKNALAGLSIPPGILNVNVQRAALEIKPFEPSVALTGTCNLGNLEIVVKRVTQSRQATSASSAQGGAIAQRGAIAQGGPSSPAVWKALVGVSMSAPLGLATIHPSLNALDRLKVTNVSLILSSMDDKVDTELTVFKGLGLDVSIPKGLTFLGHIDLKNYNVDVARIVGINNFIFRASIPANPANLMLEAIANYLGLPGEARRRR